MENKNKQKLRITLQWFNSYDSDDDNSDGDESIVVKSQSNVDSD